jgi:phosphoribosylglycinamide formyltransferase-1
VTRPNRTRSGGFGRNDFRVAVLASGAGTNLQAILDTVHGRDGIEVACVVSNRPKARALSRARRAGIETAAFERGPDDDRDGRDAGMAAWLQDRDLDLIVMAGYMELLSPPFVARFPNRIVNLHPALLPSFPGLDAIERAIEHGVKVTGVTVHFVDEGMDTGPIIAQRPVEVPDPPDLAELERRVHAVEHELLPEAIRLIASGRVRVDEGNPRMVSVDGASRPVA